MARTTASTKAPRPRGAGKLSPRGGSAGRRGKIECRVCAAMLKPENMDSHMERVHPGGEASEAARQALLQRKMVARRNNIKRGLRVALPVVVVALLIGAAYYLAFVYKADDDAPPGWKLESHNGVVYDSDDYYKTSKVTLVQFVHTDWSSCHEMANRMFDVYENYFNFAEHKNPENADKLTKIFSIGGYRKNDTGGWDTMEELRDFRDGYGNWWPFLYDVNHDLYQKYGFEKFPALVMVKNNKVVFSHEGLISREAIFDELDRHMGPPPWILKDTNGQTHDSVDSYRSGLTLVEFMHTECDTCKSTAPILRDIHNQYGTQLKGMFTIGGYALHSTLDTGSTLGNFKAQYGHDWPYLIDEERDLMEQYDFQVFPALVLVKDNEVVYRHKGAITYQELSDRIELYL